MRRRIGQIEGSGGGGETEATPFCHVKLEDGLVKDVIGGYNVTSYTYITSGEYFSRSSGTAITLFVFVNGVATSFYVNKKNQWKGAKPKPPSNGVSPDYFGEGIRIRVNCYCTTVIVSSRANGTPIVASLSHNHAAYAGFNISMKGNTSTFYINRFTNYSSTSSSIGAFTINQDSANPMTIQIDMTEDNYRIKLFQYGSNVVVGDSGVQDGNFGTEKRYTPLITSTWGYDVDTKPTIWVKEYMYYKQSVLSDFMN